MDFFYIDDDKELNTVIKENPKQKGNKFFSGEKNILTTEKRTFIVSGIITFFFALWNVSTSSRFSSLLYTNLEFIFSKPSPKKTFRMQPNIFFDLSGHAAAVSDFLLFLLVRDTRSDTRKIDGE